MASYCRMVSPAATALASCVHKATFFVPPFALTSA
jgi:hypothetical protein